MTRLIVCVLVLGTGVAGAKPLPAGLKIVEKDNHLLAVRGGVAVPVFDPESEEAQQGYSDLKGAELSADGKQIVIKAGSCIHVDSDTPIEVPLAAVEARIENSLGMQVHVKKQYDAAIAHFTAAAQGDPATPVYATNLLSAQSLANNLDDADRTLATYAPRNVPWFVWRLAVDPELARVRGRPSAKALASVKASTLTYKALGESIAISPLGLVATHEWIAVGIGPGQSDLAIADQKTGAKLLRLHAVELADACAPGKDTMFPCKKGALARSAKHAREIDAVLAALGFEKQPTAWVDNSNLDHKVVSPDKKIAIEHVPGSANSPSASVTVSRGKDSATIHTDDLSPPRQIGFAPKHVVLQYRSSYACGGADSTQSSTVVVPLPAAPAPAAGGS